MLETIRLTLPLVFLTVLRATMKKLHAAIAIEMVIYDAVSTVF